MAPKKEVISIENKRRLRELLSSIATSSKQVIGYPVSRSFDYEPLFEFLKYNINNIGDPFDDGMYEAQTHLMEREVVTFFANLFRANPNDYWGYITNGGSESNLYGLYLARETYPKGMVYYSTATHYSVRKNIHLLNIPGIMIRTQENGEMDYEDLEHTLQLNRDKPAIVMANFGTTMTEAKDNVIQIKAILRKMAIQDHYIHCDAALAGNYGAFMEPKLPFDFEDGVDSIAISGHKFLGSPFPSGVVVTRRSLKDRIARGVSYIGAYDTTITGSRNGHSPLFLWYAIQQLGVRGLKDRYKHCLETAQYCLNRMQEIGVPAWTNPGAITVVLPKMAQWLKYKWQLATEENVSHVICMPNVTKEQIDEFIFDVKQAMAQKEKQAMSSLVN